MQATNQLIDAWDYLDRTEGRAQRLALGAGVAVAVHVADDPGLSPLREEVLDVVDGQRELLPASARPVVDAMTGRDRHVTPTDLRERADDNVDELERLECRAFARLLEIER